MRDPSSSTPTPRRAAAPRAPRTLPAAGDPLAPTTPRVVMVLLAVLIPLVGSAALAQGAGDPVTPDTLAAFVPDTWHGVASTDVSPTMDRSGAATVVAHYDDPEDGRSSRDLTLALTDLGPYRDAAELVDRADVAAGRARATTVGGYPGYASVRYGDPHLEVFAGRVWVRSDSFGERFDADALRAAVEALPLDALAALADRPVAPDASYRPLGFTPGALRHFLPETLLGLPREDGYYAKRHPTGVAWGGFLYGGTHDGRDLRLRVTVWDLGTIAASAEARLARDGSGWQPFTRDGRTGFVQADAAAPTAMLDVARFRVTVEPLGDGPVDPAWLEGAFDELGLERLDTLATLVPAPTPARDPLLPQPELIAPDTLAQELPTTLAGYARGEIRAEVRSSRRDPYDTAVASATYAAGDGTPAFTLAVLDQGIVTLGVREQERSMAAIEVAGHAAYGSEDPASLLAVVGGRVVVSLRAGPDAADVSLDDLRGAFEALDLSGLEAEVPGGG